MEQHCDTAPSSNQARNLSVWRQQQQTGLHVCVESSIFAILTVITFGLIGEACSRSTGCGFDKLNINRPKQSRSYLASSLIGIHWNKW